VNGCAVRVERGDISAMDVDAFVFAARPDLNLGSGHGTAIAVRGGAAIQQELTRAGKASVGQAVVTGGGNLKAKWIVHAVVPRFQEADEDTKLRAAALAALACAEAKGVRRLAVPPMGSGFYGMPTDRCARVLVGAVKDHLGGGGSGLKELVFCVCDPREIGPFQACLDASQEVA
jgi:O-acetyl-ADP-ribose deacetylase (regulator of RNase III)